MKPRCATTLLLITLVCAPFSAARAQPTELNLHPSYAQTLWPAGHRDSANSDFVPVVMSRNNRIKAHLLQGYPIFWAPLSGPEGNLYVTSGKGGGHSNLHAISADGEVLWKAPVERSLDDLDAYAIINAPVVDHGGDVYVGDRNQLWAFRSDGQVKWVADLAPHGVEWGFVTVVLASGGRVGGISSEGKVIFFRSADGELAMPVLDLPGGDGPPAEDTPPGSLWQGLMDPSIKPFMFNLIQGWEMEVANTPAVHPMTGRIYITAAGVEPGAGLLYGIDVHDDRLEIAFQTDMGGGSGTSPAISHDGNTVYALDEEGHMVAVDATSGEKLWETREDGGGAASPSVGPDGRIYTGNLDHLLAFRSDGSLAWRRDYNAFCAEQIPTLSGFWSWIFSPPVAFVDSLFTVAAREGWLNIVCGYDLKLMPSNSRRTRVPVPQKSLVVPIDLRDGSPLDSALPIPETSEGFILPVLNGNTIVTLSGAITSIFYNMLNPLLPERLEIPNEARAGLLLLEPISRRALARDAVGWLKMQNARALAALEAGDAETVRVLLKQGAMQRLSLEAVLEKIAAEEGTTLDRGNRLLNEIRVIHERVEQGAGLPGGDEATAKWLRYLGRAGRSLQELDTELLGTAAARATQ
ncbi:MAG: PQQ-binding-like beta-propeller repeat protein [bacterium]|nr:PQQ-binding-like beta-propeller repeat protein [bacterium]